jgi:hypothetical protein
MSFFRALILACLIALCFTVVQGQPVTQKATLVQDQPLKQNGTQLDLIWKTPEFNSTLACVSAGGDCRFAACCTGFCLHTNVQGVETSICVG